MPRAYVCGPLIEAAEEDQRNLRILYYDIRDVFASVTGRPACIPHDHFDQPLLDRKLHEITRKKHCESAWCHVIVPVNVPDTDWNGFQDVLAIGYERQIPAILLCWQGHLDKGQISTSLLRHPSVAVKIVFFTKDEALARLERVVTKMWLKYLSEHNVHPELALV